MNKAVHALVYVILLVAGAALYFEWNLYNKKELLTDRNNQLIDALVEVSGSIEAEDPPKSATQPEANKDVSPIDAKSVEATVQTTPLLEDYKCELETQGGKTLQWKEGNNRAQLHVLYALDGEGNKQQDPNSPGNFLKTGPGTAQELLDKLNERAKAQRANLNTTRQALKDLRGKFEELVADYNKLPPEMRKDKKEIEDLKKNIEELEQQKEAVEEQLKKTKAQVEDLNSEIASLKDEVTTAKEETEAVKEELAKAEKLKEQLMQMLKKQAASQSVAAAPGSAVTSLPAGDKGTLVFVDNANMFAIVKFSDEAIQELVGAERQNALPPLEMGVRRKGAAGAKDLYVGHIRLHQLIQGTNYVKANILRDWVQAPAAVGDIVSAE